MDPNKKKTITLKELSKDDLEAVSGGAGVEQPQPINVASNSQGGNSQGGNSQGGGGNSNFGGNSSFNVASNSGFGGNSGGFGGMSGGGMSA